MRSEDEAPPPAPQRPEPLSVAGAVFPGVLLHGSGSWLMGDAEVARCLMLTEGVGVGMLFGSMTGIALTGASRVIVGPLAASSVLGAGLFGVTWLADIYHVSVPLEYRGSFRKPPTTESFLGYVGVAHPQFSMGHLVEHGAALRFERLRLSYLGRYDPAAFFGSLNAEGGYRLWAGGRHASGRLDGSSLDLSLAFWRREFLEEDFRTRSVEARATLRTDTERLMPSFPGAFTELEIGYARRSTDLLLGFAQQEDSMLIAGASFGAYLPGDGVRGGEAELYYNHRHDGLVGGMLASGLGSGVLGRVGLRAHYFVGEHMGLGASARVGSAWVLGLNLRFRDRAGDR